MALNLRLLVDARTFTRTSRSEFLSFFLPSATHIDTSKGVCLPFLHGLIANILERAEVAWAPHRYGFILSTRLISFPLTYSKLNEAGRGFRHNNNKQTNFSHNDKTEKFSPLRCLASSTRFDTCDGDRRLAGDRMMYVCQSVGASISRWHLLLLMNRPQSIFRCSQIRFTRNSPRPTLLTTAARKERETSGWTDSIINVGELVRAKKEREADVGLNGPRYGF